MVSRDTTTFCRVLRPRLLARRQAGGLPGVSASRLVALMSTGFLGPVRNLASEVAGRSGREQSRGVAHRLVCAQSQADVTGRGAVAQP